MIRILVAGAAATVTATMLTFAPAEAAAYGVTLKTDLVKADVGKPFRLAGTVTGKGAGSKKLIIQRKIGSKPWSNYSTVTTRPTGTYAKTLTMASVGAKSFRVLVPKAGKLSTGTSNTVKVTGYTWLDLYDESYFTDGVVQRGWTGELNDEVPPRHSISLSGGAYVAWRPTSLCDSTEFDLAAPGSSGPDQDVKIRSAIETTVQVNAGTPYSLTRPLSGASILSMENLSNEYVVIMAPRAHCAVTTLPISYD